MSETLTYKDLAELSKKAHGTCISIFMPTNPEHRERQEGDIIRLRNLIDQAESAVRAAAPDLRTPAIEALLAPANALLHADRARWPQAGKGLAIFLALDFVQILCVPLPVEDLVVVGRQFHLKPLLPLVTENGQFYVLAMSQNAVRLLHGDRFGIRERALNGIPHSLAETLQYDVFERTLQRHGGSGPGSGGAPGSGRFATIGGQVIGTEETHKEQLQRFLKELANGMKIALNGEHAPLILAGVDYVLAIYRQVNQYPHLVADALVGNPDTLTDQELHDRAWTLLTPLFERKRQAAADRYQQLVPTKRACNDLRTALTAAHQGRVDTLFTAVGQQQWGYYDAESGYIHLYDEATPGSDDLFNLTAIETLKNGGTLYPVAPEQVPGQRGIAAIYRY